MKEEMDFPRRFNVGYMVEGDVLTAVLDANRALNGQGPGEIAFRPDGDAIPHITMAMGSVDNESFLQKIMAAVDLVAAKLEPVSFTLGQPYFHGSDGVWFFADVEPRAKFHTQRLMLANSLSNLMKFQKFGGPDNPPHVTLGYVASNAHHHTSPVVPTLETVTGQARMLHVAETGLRGTCTKQLRVFEVGNR